MLGARILDSVAFDPRRGNLAARGLNLGATGLLYHTFNGKDGKTPLGPDLTVDGAHPSQKGNDLIAELIGKVDASGIE